MCQNCHFPFFCPHQRIGASALRQAQRPRFLWVTAVRRTTAGNDGAGALRRLVSWSNHSDRGTSVHDNLVNEDEGVVAVLGDIIADGLVLDVAGFSVDGRT